MCALAISAGLVRAQSGLPTGWSSRDIGSTGVAGSAAVSSGTWTIDGQRSQHLWVLRRVPFRVSADQRRRRHPRQGRELRGRSRLVEGRRDDPGNAGRQRAQRVHDGDAADSGRFLQSRSNQGGQTNRLTGFSGAAPVWLRLVRQGSQFTGYFSADGTSWTTAGAATINMTAAAYVGLAVSSRVDSTLATATFTNLQVSAGPATATLPAPWTSRDLGSPALAGRHRRRVAPLA